MFGRPSLAAEGMAGMAALQAGSPVAQPSLAANRLAIGTAAPSLCLYRFQRKHHGKLHVALWQAPEAVISPLHEREKLPVAVRELIQRLDAQPGVRQRIDDGAQAVNPLIGCVR